MGCSPAILGVPVGTPVRDVQRGNALPSALVKSVAQMDAVELVENAMEMMSATAGNVSAFLRAMQRAVHRVANVDRYAAHRVGLAHRVTPALTGATATASLSARERNAEMTVVAAPAETVMAIRVARGGRARMVPVRRTAGARSAGTMAAVRRVAIAPVTRFASRELAWTAHASRIAEERNAGTTAVGGLAGRVTETRRARLRGLVRGVAA